MRLDNLYCNVSRSQTIGNELKTPLYNAVTRIIAPKSIRNCHELIVHVVKVIFSVLLLIPMTLPWIVGTVVIHLSSHSVNLKNLSKTPPPIFLIENPEALENVQVNELYNRYRRLDLSNDQNRGGARLFFLCESLKPTSSRLGFLPERVEFNKQLALYVKGIVAKLESGEVSADVERDVLIEMAIASTRCHPTWLEVAARMYAKLHGREETGPVKLLRLVQDYKESLILDFTQNRLGREWHAINYVRTICGKELGLNTELSRLDPYQPKKSLLGKALVKWIFLYHYENVSRLITGVTSSINSQEYDSTYFDMLLDIVRQKNIQHPEDYVIENFYDEDNKIKPQAVHLLLRSIDILT